MELYLLVKSSKVYRFLRPRTCFSLFLGTMVALGGAPLDTKASAYALPLAYQGAQTKNITGKVTSEGGEPLIGVTVVLKGTTTATSTGISGDFSLNVPQSGGTLVFSYVGYLNKEVPLEGQSSITVTLDPDVKVLEEVVVVGYGEQKRASMVASIAQVKGEELLGTGTTQSVSQSLQGMMPGMTVMNSDGIPGKGAHDINIRGISTTGNTAPLTIVDGVERSIHMLDPNEIESISILKDASATAVYGVRGANGVIMITTKRGETGKPQFNFSTTITLKKPTVTQDHPDFITTMELYNEANRNDGRWDALIPESEIQAWRDNIHLAGPYNQYFPQINWSEELLREFGPQQQYNMNVRGGTKFMKYFVSLGYINEGDIFRTDFQENPLYKSDFGHKRYNWRSNFDFQLTKTTEFSISFAGNSRKTMQPTFLNVNNFFVNMRNTPSNVFPIKYEDGEWGDSQGGGDNMLALITSGGQNISEGYEGFYDATLKQNLDKITKGLSFEGKIAYTSNSNYYTSIFTERAENPNLSLTGSVRYYRKYDYSNPIEGPGGTISYPLVQETRYPAADYLGGRPPGTTYDEFRGYGRTLFYQFSTNYKREFGKHAVTALALMNRQEEVGAGTAVDFPFPEYREDWVGRATYGFDEKYLMEVNAAYTGSEKFAQGKRYGFFPSIGVGYVISEEPFMKNLTGKFLDFLKVRYSYGKMGNDRGAPRFAYTQLYSTGGNIFFGYNSTTPYGPLYYEGQAANPYQTWETSYKQNFGVDFDFIGKISGTVDVYKERREGILMDFKTIPVWFGAEPPSGNIARTKNQGIEVSLKWRDKIGSDFNYYIKGDLHKLDNRIVFFDDPRLADDYKKHAGKPLHWDRNGPRLISSGYYGSLDDIFNGAPASLGTAMDKIVPGDLMFVDFNANGLTNVEDEVVMENQLYPKTVASLGFGFSYKNFDFSALIYGVTDVNRTISSENLWDFAGGQVMAHPNVASRWTPETAGSAEKPSLHINNAHNSSRSTYQFVDGSYVRLENLEVAYKVKHTGLTSVGIDRVQLFANFSDLWTWTAVDTRIDPEAFGGNTYPVVKRYNFGLRASF